MDLDQFIAENPDKGTPPKRIPSLTTIVRVRESQLESHMDELDVTLGHIDREALRRFFKHD